MIVIICKFVVESVVVYEEFSSIEDIKFVKSIFVEYE